MSKSSIESNKKRMVAVEEQWLFYKESNEDNLFFFELYKYFFTHKNG